MPRPKKQMRTTKPKRKKAKKGAKSVVIKKKKSTAMSMSKDDVSEVLADYDPYEVAAGQRKRARLVGMAKLWVSGLVILAMIMFAFWVFLRRRRRERETVPTGRHAQSAA